MQSDHFVINGDNFNVVFDSFNYFYFRRLALVDPVMEVYVDFDV
jgi:hypothetical protein